jgi:hypothetical protein
MTLCGLFMFMFTPKIKSPPIERNVRSCPSCAETIKCAAIKCPHCEAEVEAVAAPQIASGWITSIPCKKYGSHQSRIAEAVVVLGLPVVHIPGTAVGVGPFRTKYEAMEARDLLLESYKFFSVIEFRKLPEKHVSLEA